MPTVAKQKSTSKKQQQQQQQKQENSLPNSEEAIRLCPKTGDLILSLHIKPGAKVTQLTQSESNAIIDLSIAAPPVDGQANSAVLAYVAELLHCRKSDVSLQSGAKSRDKLLRISASAGISFQTARLALLPSAKE